MKIAAVIVTYNRLPLLKECLFAIQSQTRELDNIYVINNGSTDGTKEWLSINSNFEVLNEQNLGGANGFFVGIKKDMLADIMKMIGKL